MANLNSAKTRTKILIADLNPKTKFDELKIFLNIDGYKDAELEFCVDKFGKVIDCAMATVPPSAVSKLLELNGRELHGSRVQISKSEDKKKKEEAKPKASPSPAPTPTPTPAAVTPKSTSTTNDRNDTDDTAKTKTEDKENSPKRPRYNGPRFRRRPRPRPKFNYEPSTVTTVPHRYNLVDAGVNLTHRKFKFDLEYVIKRSKTCGIQKMIATGTSIHHTQEALTLSRIYKDFLFFTAGVHPHDAKKWTDDSVAKLEELAKKPECLAIGECGLDFNRNFSPKEQQLHVFEQQVQLACRLKKPLFLHEREAHTDLVAVLTKYKKQLPPVLIHCFTGLASEAKAYINQGFFIGLTSFLLKDKSEDGVVKAITDKIITAKKLLLESDAPFMFPRVPEDDEGKQMVTKESLDILNEFCSFKRNEPCSLPTVVEAIAHYMKMDPKALAETTTRNAYSFYKIPQ